MPTTTERAIEVCTDVTPPHGDFELLASLALQESERNAPDPVQLAAFAANTGIDTPASAVLLTGKRWKTGRTITVSFLDGSERLRRRVHEFARRWLWDANLGFRFLGLGEGGDVRITFNRGGSWSYLGTDALSIPRDQPTMQYGWLDEGSAEEEVRRVVLHEFGHMLALGHEQAHPEGDIPWNRQACYDYYRRTQGWSEQQVRQQVFQVYSRALTNYSRYDPLSIMHYAIPAALVTDPSRAVRWNTGRSHLDRHVIEQRYPGKRGDVDMEEEAA